MPRPGAAYKVITVSGGTGFGLFFLTGEIKRIIITKPSADNDAAWTMTDANGQSVANGVCTPDALEHNIALTPPAPVLDPQQFVITGPDGVYRVGIYGDAVAGNWTYA